MARECCGYSIIVLNSSWDIFFYLFYCTRYTRRGDHQTPLLVHVCRGAVSDCDWDLSVTIDPADLSRLPGSQGTAGLFSPVFTPLTSTPPATRQGRTLRPEQIIESNNQEKYLSRSHQQSNTSQLVGWEQICTLLVDG